jgi:hypothetical protein
MSIQLHLSLLLAVLGPLAVTTADAANSLLTAEVFLDNPGLAPGTGTQLTLADTSAEALRAAVGVLDLVSVAPGAHTVYLRFRDTTGTWSEPIGQTLKITPAAPGAPRRSRDNRVVAAEGFIDSDPGQGLGTALPVSLDGAIEDPSEVLGGQISLAGLRPGAHTLYLRFRDQAGAWSPVTAQSFQISICWECLPSRRGWRAILR